MSSRIERIAPSLIGSPYEVTSAATDDYNCIAWAVYDTKQWWWPTPQYACYWPPGVPRNNSLGALESVFNSQGYQSCETLEHEPGFEKLAIYEHSAGGVEHVARQLKSGEWTSKIGEWEDIRHSSPKHLEGDEYGMVKMVMKRPRKEWDQ